MGQNIPVLANIPVLPLYGRSWVRFPSGTQIFSLSPPPPSCDMLNIASFLISSPSLKFTIFLYLSPIGHFDIADPCSMQDACHHELSKYDDMTYARHESPNGSVFRASDRCMPIGRSWVRSRRGLRFFLCPTLATC